MYKRKADNKTLASSSSWSVLTPKRGIEVLERLELWDSFLTPLMWLIDLSFRVGDGISTSFCLSTDWWTNEGTKKDLSLTSGERGEAVWTELSFWSNSPMKVLEMYSDTWLPERLISDRWDSSLFSILLNCGRMRRKHRNCSRRCFVLNKRPEEVKSKWSFTTWPTCVLCDICEDVRKHDELILTCWVVGRTHTLLEAISLTERCVWMVSSWSKHQSSSSRVSRASCWYCWSDSFALGLMHTPPRGDLLRASCI